VIALIQRVTRAEVRVADRVVGSIGPGTLALIGVQREDNERSADRLLERILSYRIFSDAEGRMNLSLRDTGGGLLLVSQFTLVADTQQGTRAGFSRGAAPEEARRLFDYLAQKARAMHSLVETGEFAADMKVSLINDGPVTFWLESKGDG
jgi:D-tyrosyl-tRNA(Tyr) deacylase